MAPSRADGAGGFSRASEGATRFAEIGPRMGDVQDSFLAPLDESQRAQLIDLLIRVTGGAAGA